MRENLMKGQNWQEIADHQKKSIFGSSSANDDIERYSFISTSINFIFYFLISIYIFYFLISIYIFYVLILSRLAKQLEKLEDIMPPPRCAVCGEPAPKKCFRCKNEWYLLHPLPIIPLSLYPSPLSPLFLYYFLIFGNLL
jgi:hypothetical protein